MHSIILISVNCASGIIFALLGHTLALWMYAIGYSIKYLTFIGVAFATPYVFKAFLCAQLIKYIEVDKCVIYSLFFLQYFLLVGATYVEPGNTLFFTLLASTAIVNAVFHAFIVGQICQGAEGKDLSFINTYLYAGDLIGLIIGNNVVFYASQYFTWCILYRSAAALSFCCGLAIFNLNISLVRQSSITNAGIEFFQRLRSSGVLLIAIIVATRLQSSFLSQTPTLFCLEYMRLDVSAITWLKFICYIGMLVGVICAKTIPTDIKLAKYILAIKAIPILAFVILSSFDAPSVYLLIFAMIIEKFGRSIERVLISSLQMSYTNSAHATLQVNMLDSIGQIARAVGEMISGPLVMTLGWQGFFIYCLCFSLLIIIALQYIQIDSPK